MCPCNTAIMTAEHLLQHCQLHDDLRRDMWSEPTLLRDKLYGNLEEVSRFHESDRHLRLANDDDVEEARVQSRTDQAVPSIQHVCSLTEHKQTKDSGKTAQKFFYETWQQENLRTLGSTEMQRIVKVKNKSFDTVIYRYTDGSVTRKQSRLRFTVKFFGRTTQENSSADKVTPSSPIIEAEAVTGAVQWVAI